MARVSYNTPMMAYDHVRDMLKDAAGPDGIVSRTDVKKLVRQLRKDGRGSEAVAARNMFKIIDSRDNAAGARVTGFDLTASRRYFKKEMLTDYDLNKNGFSNAEMQNLSPTMRAMVAAGQMLKVQKAGGRISHATPEKGMNHIAALITQAAGPDGIISRDDIKALTRQLYKEGRGTEELAVRYFYNFTDHRDYRAGARVTPNDIRKAVDYSGTKLLKAKDGNRNGYSKAEYAEFSTTAKAFTLVGKMIEAGIVKPAN